LRYARAGRIERFGLRNPNYKIKKTLYASEYRDALDREQFRNLYKFTCVRNPWDRMVSNIFYAYANSGNLGPEKIPEDNL